MLLAEEWGIVGLNGPFRAWKVMEEPNVNEQVLGRRVCSRLRGQFNLWISPVGLLSCRMEVRQVMFARRDRSNYRCLMLPLSPSPGCTSNLTIGSVLHLFGAITVIILRVPIATINAQLLDPERVLVDLNVVETSAKQYRQCQLSRICRVDILGLGHSHAQFEYRSVGRG